MKKLGKLQINSEKIMKNEELIILRGGSEPEDCHCICYTDDPIPQIVGIMAAFNYPDCLDNCQTLDPSYHCTWNCLY